MNPSRSSRAWGRTAPRCLRSKGIFSLEDLLYTMPFRYEDRSNLKPISALAPGETATVVGEVRAAGSFGSRSSRARIFEVTVRDASGVTMSAKWFRGDYLQKIFEVGQSVALYGKIEWNRYESRVEILHPEYEILRPDDEQAALHLGRITPIYRAIGKINTRAIRGLIGRALEVASFPKIRCRKRYGAGWRSRNGAERCRRRIFRPRGPTCDCWRPAARRRSSG
jgi:RecG-like helicase